MTGRANILQTITQRLNNEYKRKYTHFRIKNGIGFYIEGGKEVPIETFKKKYPVLINRKENYDTTKNFMNA